jgi:hypothetical protein
VFRHKIDELTPSARLCQCEVSVSVRAGWRWQ